jgi:O-antigen/teichoic acid export membrane protein
LLKIKSEFLTNVVTLMTGTTISQIIPIITTPFLTRIYLPQDYGVLGVYLSVATIIGIMSTMSYSSAILLPEKEDDSISIVQICLASVLIWTIISCILAFFLNVTIATLLKTPDVSKYFYFLPVSTLAIGLGNTFSVWANRNKYYHFISISRVTAAILTFICSIILGLLVKGPTGLIIALLVNQLTVPAILIFYSSRRSDAILKFHSSGKLVSQAKSYIKFPKFGFPAELINNFINQLPIYLLSIFSGKNEVGYFNLSNRILGLPVTFIGGAIGDVFRQRASSDYAQQGNCRTIFLKTFKTLLKLSIIPFFVLTIFAPQIFSIALGANWHEAGVYTRYLCILYFLRFTISPLSYLFYIRGRQIEDLLITTYLFISSFLLLLVFLKKSIYFALLLYSLNYSLAYLYVFFRTLFFSKGKHN